MATALKSAVQAGPMVVDPGAKNGIYVNDYNRHDRTSVCLSRAGNVIIVVVKGGLSLFELGEILVDPGQGWRHGLRACHQSRRRTIDPGIVCTSRMQNRWKLKEHGRLRTAS